jgi:hypothetical protein
MLRAFAGWRCREPAVIADLDAAPPAELGSSGQRMYVGHLQLVQRPAQACMDDAADPRSEGDELP